MLAFPVRVPRLGRWAGSAVAHDCLIVLACQHVDDELNRLTSAASLLEDLNGLRAFTE